MQQVKRVKMKNSGCTQKEKESNLAKILRPLTTCIQYYLVIREY